MNCKWYLLWLGCFNIVLAQREAVIMVPVADCLGESLERIHKREPEVMYETLPLCTNGSSYSCPRINQLLFNQRITVLEETSNEVKIQLPHLFFQLKDNPQRLNICWTKKKYILYIDQLKRYGIDIRKIPPSCDAEKNLVPENAIVTLIVPHYNKKINLHFSAGTRFVRAPSNDPSHPYQPVYALNPKTMTINTLLLPKNKLLITKGKSQQEKQACFVKILKKWAHRPQGFIPYVWGGNSIRRFCQLDTFSQIADKYDTIWYKRHDSYFPHTGLDCAGMIILAAQLCGIPFYLKNSTAIKRNLREIKPHEPLEVGDIIWIPAHVMVVADMKKGTIIEARHYNHGYGKVHELPLAALFQGITSFKALRIAMEQNQPLLRLDAEEKVVQTISDVKILKLRSVWK